MSRSLNQLLGDLKRSQVKSIEKQRRVTQSVNEVLAGGLGGISEVADALDRLRQRPPSAFATPAPSGGDTASALRRALAEVAEAQLDATRRNEHIANAVTAGVVGGLDGLADVAHALRKLNVGVTQDQPRLGNSVGDTPGYSDVPANSTGDSITVARVMVPDDPATAAGDSHAAQRIMVCPTCAGSGQVRVD